MFQHFDKRKKKKKYFNISSIVNISWNQNTQKMFFFLSKVKHCFVSYFHRFIEIFLTTFGEFTGSAYQLYKLQCPLVFVSGNILLALARQKCCPVQFVRYRFYYLNIFRVSVVSYSNFLFNFFIFLKTCAGKGWDEYECIWKWNDTKVLWRNLGGRSQYLKLKFSIVTRSSGVN